MKNPVEAYRVTLECIILAPNAKRALDMLDNAAASVIAAGAPVDSIRMTAEEAKDA